MGEHANGTKSHLNRNPPIPRLYKTASYLLGSVQEGKSINDLIYTVKYGNIKAIYALVCNAIRNESLLSEILTDSGLCKEKINENLARILVTELLWGKKTVMVENPIIQMVQSYLPKLEKSLENSSIPETKEKELKPRYVRVNTLLTSVETAIRKLKGDGWSMDTTPTSYKKFRKKIVELGEREFLKDFHFDDLLVFSPKANLFDHRLVNDCLLLLHDKASCLPVVLLNPPPGSTVLDMCAAPGMKTLHLAAMMQNEGCLYAVDQHLRRYNLLEELIKEACPQENCVEPMLRDSLSLTADDCPGVKYILVDPSCSGVGMSKRVEDRDSDGNLSMERIRKLSAFQWKLLKHALTAFPDVERVVYSTCSELVEENEEVIRDVLAVVPDFHIVPPTNISWKRKGNSLYDFGSNCLVASRKRDLTNGFFTAVFERVSKNVPVTKLHTTQETHLKTKKKRKSNVLEVAEATKKVKKVKSVSNE